MNRLRHRHTRWAFRNLGRTRRRTDLPVVLVDNGLLLDNAGTSRTVPVAGMSIDPLLKMR